MVLASVDRQSVRRSVVDALRRQELCLGDVVALDTLVEPCLDMLRTSRLPAFAPFDLRSPAAVATFIAAFESAVGGIAGDAYAGALGDLAAALDALPVRVSAGTAGPEPLDDVDVLIDTWVERIADNDRATALHSRAVGAWCHRIGSRLSLDTDRIAHVARCGTMHDVGKMVTPLEILLAARPLTAHEWDVMQRHVTDGWNMVAGERHLAPFAGSVRGHHERFDGGGYPDGAAGDSIDLSTRIVTVADAFNAMIADRPYRLPLSPTVAIAELQRHRGTQFDPDCVDAMVDVVLGRA